MRGFFSQSYYTYKGLFMWLNWPGFISSIFLSPIASVLMYNLIWRFNTGARTTDYVIGIIVYMMSFPCFDGIAQSYAYDRTFGTLPFVFATNTSRVVNYLARGVLHYPSAIVAFALGLITACLTNDIVLAPANWGLVVLAVLIIAFSIVGFSQILGIISVITRNWVSVQYLSLGILMVFCGAVIPLSAYPRFIGALGHIFPITHGLTAVREALSGGSFAAVRTDILYELIVGIGYSIAAYVAFRFFESHVRRTGSLQQESQ